MTPKPSVRGTGSSSFSLNKVAWLADRHGEWIVAGGAFGCALVRRELLLSESLSPLDVCAVQWPASQTSAVPRFLPIGTDRIMEILALPRRSAIVIATQRSLAAYGSDGLGVRLGGEEEFSRQHQAADFRDGAGKFNISMDGKIVEFEDYRSTASAPIRLRFDLNSLKLDRIKGMAAELAEPDQDPNLVDGWPNSSRPPNVFGEEVPASSSFPNELHRSIALLPAKRLALIGTTDAIRVVGFADSKLSILCERASTAEAYRVNITSDGSLAVVGHSDGVLRWYRITGASACNIDHVLSTYVMHNDRGEWIWVSWLPSGAFASDPRAKGLISWQTNDGSDYVRVVPFGRLLDLYDRKSVRAALDKPTDGDSWRTGQVKLQEAFEQRVAREAAVRPILHVLSPNAFQYLETEAVTFRLEVEEGGAWPKLLTVELASGVRLASVGSAPDEAKRILLERAGQHTVTVALPQIARAHRRAVHVCFYLDSERHACQPIIWSGKLTQAPRRRLWAVLVGLSHYDDKRLSLRFAQNDALDLAQLFLDDFNNRVVHKRSNTLPDFDEVHVDLIVSPLTASAKERLRRMKAMPFVTVREPTRDGILGALRDLGERGQREDLSNDLLLFHYSGHGVVHPYNQSRGRTALLMPQTSGNLVQAEFEQTTLGSDTFLDGLQKIAAQKLIILDACRVPSHLPTATPFDPALVAQEFEGQALSAHFFFSGLPGQYSWEDAKLAFNMRLPAAERGNGMFSFAILTALTNAVRSTTIGRGENKVDVIGLKRKLDSFFDLKDGSSPASRFSRAKKIKDMQEPVYIPARYIYGSQVVRTIE